MMELKVARGGGQVVSELALHLNVELKATFQLFFIYLSKKLGCFCIQPNIFYLIEQPNLLISTPFSITLNRRSKSCSTFPY